MCVYVPAALSDLCVPLPPMRSSVLRVPEAGMSGEDIEVLEDDTITEAALSSLGLARETRGAGIARVVLAVDTPTSTTLTPGEQIKPHILAAPALECTWLDVAAILADLPDASPVVRAVLSTDTQENADEAMATLWESSLAWSDRSERPAVPALRQGRHLRTHAEGRSVLRRRSHLDLIRDLGRHLLDVRDDADRASRAA